MFEGREVAALAKFELLLKISGEIVVPRKLNRRTKRRVGLDEHFAWRLAATGAAGHLREQLKCSLARTEVRQVQREIGVDDPNQSDIREMQAFRNHLRPDQDVDLACAKT